jgi:glutaredoxin 3
MQPVDIYTTRWCPYCHAAKALLKRKSVDFKEIDVSGSAERQAMMQRAPDATTVPQIFIGSVHVGGCDDLHALERAGKLDPLLAGEDEGQNA